MSDVLIGTSGWQYWDWRGRFYPEGLPQRKWLEYFSQHFKTVEVNATFYHQMKPATFENWAKVVPDDFVFAVKASRFITHIKRLNVDNLSINRLIDSMKLLGGKLGPILFQLPPRFKADEKRLEEFFQTLTSEEPIQSPRRWPTRPAKPWRSGEGLLRGGKMRLKLAFEFRDPSWFSEPIYQILRKHNVALVIAESGGSTPSRLRGASRWPYAEVITADFTYIRFHGEAGSYSSKYTDEELVVWAKKIKKWQRRGVDVYAYFNNDVGAFAVENAKTLMSMIKY